MTNIIEFMILSAIAYTVTPIAIFAIASFVCMGFHLVNGIKELNNE